MNHRRETSIKSTEEMSLKFLTCTDVRIKPNDSDDYYSLDFINGTTSSTIRKMEW